MEGNGMRAGATNNEKRVNERMNGIDSEVVRSGTGVTGEERGKTHVQLQSEANPTTTTPLN